MLLLTRFIHDDSGSGGEDWIVLSAAVAAVIGTGALFLLQGGAEPLLRHVRQIITVAVAEVGGDGNGATGLEAPRAEAPPQSGPPQTGQAPAEPVPKPAP